MTRIGPNWWIKDFNDFKDMKKAVDNGSHIACPITFSHEFKDSENVYYCFRPDNRMADGVIYVTTYYIHSVFDLIKPNVTVDFDGNKLMFTPEKLIVNDKKSYKYKYDGDYDYKLQKTQYKSSSAYKMIEFLVDPFWHNMIKPGLKAAGYID